MTKAVVWLTITIGFGWTALMAVPTVSIAAGIDRPNQQGYSNPGCHVLKAAILPGHPTPEDIARVEVGLAGYQLS